SRRPAAPHGSSRRLTFARSRVRAFSRSRVLAFARSYTARSFTVGMCAVRSRAARPLDCLMARPSNARTRERENAQLDTDAPPCCILDWSTQSVDYLNCTAGTDGPLYTRSTRRALFR